MRSILARSALLAGCLALTACAGATQNVRAYRAYAYESPSLLVAIDRADDLARTLDLVDVILTKTPYTPGDSWVEKLPLKNDEAAAIKAELKAQDPYDKGDYEVPVVKVYRVHLERVLKDVPDKGDYPSLLDAMGALGGDEAADVKTHWGTFQDKQRAAQDAEDAYEKKFNEVYPKSFLGIGAGGPKQPPPELVALDEARKQAKKEAQEASERVRKDIDAIAKGAASGKKAEVLKGATTAVSVAYRIELEALAMIPIVAVQAVRSLPKAGQEASESAGATIKGLKKLADLPDFIGGVKEQMSRQIALLEFMTEALAQASKETVEQTPGFELKESVVDQVVGVTLDSLRIDVHAGAEALFFTSVGSHSTTADEAAQAQQNASQSGGSSATYDYDHTANGGPGRRTKLVYDVKPIMLAAANLNIAFDYLKMPNAANFNLGYKTDAVFSSGGQIESGSLANQLGVKGVASQALDLGLGVLGVQTSVRLATFTAGTVTVADPAGNALPGPQGEPLRAPFQINYTQIDVGYDIAFLMGESAGKYYIEQLIVGGRYFRYVLPRILYEMEDQSAPDAQVHNYTFVRESPPQLVPSRYYMGGLTARFGPGPAPALAAFVDTGLYFGAGPTAYYFYKLNPDGTERDPLGPIRDPATGEDIRDIQHRNAFAANIALAVGGRLRIARPSSRLRLNAELVYAGELIFASAGANASAEGKPHTVQFGGADIFHGPRFSFVGEF